MSVCRFLASAWTSSSSSSISSPRRNCVRHFYVYKCFHWMWAARWDSLCLLVKMPFSFCTVGHRPCEDNVRLATLQLVGMTKQHGCLRHRKVSSKELQRKRWRIARWCYTIKKCIAWQCIVLCCNTLCKMSPFLELSFQKSMYECFHSGFKRSIANSTPVWNDANVYFARINSTNKRLDRQCNYLYKKIM